MPKARVSPAISAADEGVSVSPARSEGHRQLRALHHSAGEVARKVGVSRQTAHSWKTGAKVPGPDFRAALERDFSIPAQSWGREPVDRGPRSAPQAQGAARPRSQAPAPARPSTLDEVVQLLAELDHDAGFDGILASELARIRDTKTKALALKARLESADQLFEATAILKHPAWRRIRETFVQALQPYPDAARALAAALQDLAA